MKGGDLVKCSDTDSYGVITRVSVRDSSAPRVYCVVDPSIPQYDYRVLWSWGSETWETPATIIPASSEENTI